MDFTFKVPSTIPQDLLLIQDLIGVIPPPTVAANDVSNSPEFSDDSIASTDNEPESEDEVEADLALRDEESTMSAGASDSASQPDSGLGTDSSSDPEVECEDEGFQQIIQADNGEDEESGIPATPSYLQTKNEIIDTNVVVPAINEVEPNDILEKVGEIISIVGNTVIVKGLPVDHLTSLSGRALDVDSLLVFGDRKVLGYVYETFGPTSQPLYQVKFNLDYPLDTGKVWLSREVFHVPQRSHFVFVEQLKKSRGSDASNIHDEEPADDEIDFSDDEKEAAFKAQRKRRGRSVSSSKQSTPTRSQILDDATQDTYINSNPYDAYGPYDDDFHVTGPSRPPPVPYDDPYADVPTSDVRVHPMGMNDGSSGQPNNERERAGARVSRGHVSNRVTQGRGYRARRPVRGYRHSVASQRTFDPDADQFPLASQMVECATGYEQISHSIASDSFHQPAWLSAETNNNIQTYQQPFIQPHINPRFAASIFSLPPSGSMASSLWISQNPQNHAPHPQPWDNTWTMHDGAGFESQEDTYRRM